MNVVYGMKANALLYNAGIVNVGTVILFATLVGGSGALWSRIGSRDNSDVSIILRISLRVIETTLTSSLEVPMKFQDWHEALKIASVDNGINEGPMWSTPSRRDFQHCDPPPHVT
ncbi:hypothetical protein CKAH01_05470 [Colletotrichum kahawae]|uniref:Uncharacterized protein n=1 Tax=Colletotrichum kahawae TaxID=34407 RepID=A0AAD9YDN2_COLKA|nr:hypothetical protein CKAH01_05470 [Colletotrichum kahawae]